MHFLYDLGHPAHVHLFRNVARQLIARGHQVTIAIRDRDIVATLLDRYGLPYVVASKARRGRLGALLELIIHDWNIFKLAWRNRVDCLAGTSVSASHVGWILRKPSFVLNEDDADYVKRFALLAYPLASRIVIPDVLRDQRTGKTRTHRSYHELAYLHPSNFKPNPGIRARLGLQDGERFFILRLVSFRAHHDIGHTGLSTRLVGRLINLLTSRGRVLVTVEGKVPKVLEPYQFPLPPHLMHHALAFADMIISDSQTMTVEAAVLGTPAIRCNTFAGRCSIINELEERYALSWSFHPRDGEALLRQVSALLDDPDLRRIMQQRRQIMLSEKIDLVPWLVHQFETGFA